MNSPDWPSPWAPLRCGKKSTAVELVPLPSGSANPLTGFSGNGGFVVGEIAGPGFGSVPPAPGRSPHQLFSAANGTLSFGVVPSSSALIAP